MAQGILSVQNKSIASNNLLNKFCGLNSAFTWNPVSGGANGVAENAPDKPMIGTQSCRITFTGTGAYEFNCGGTEMDYTVAEDGDYILQYWLYKNDALANIDFTVKVFVNGINIADTTFEQTLNTANGFIEGNWNCYYNGTIIPLLENDVVSYSFIAESDIFGSGVKLYMDGLKLELNDINQNTEPTIYTEPLDIVIEQTETIDIGSIGSNSSVVVVATVTGAIVGDFVQMTYPVDLITVDLSVSYPIVTDVDEVSFIVHNKSGGSVNPASGDFTFKIVR
jgi:hypothetical protein